MEIATLILEYLRVLIWPMVVLTIILIFRRQIESLIERLQQADLPGGLSISLRSEIQEAKKLSQQVSAIPSSSPGYDTERLPLTEVNLKMLKLGLQPSPSGLNIDYYRELAIVDPDLALSGLRLEIDVLMRNLAKKFNIALTAQDSGEKLVKKLHSGGALTQQQSELILKILQLANASVHGYEMTRAEAEEIINIASILVEQYIAWLSWGFNDGRRSKRMS